MPDDGFDCRSPSDKFGGGPCNPAFCSADEYPDVLNAMATIHKSHLGFLICEPFHLLQCAFQGVAIKGVPGSACMPTTKFPVVVVATLTLASATLDGIEVAHMIRKRQFGPSGQSAFQQFAALAG